MVRGRVASCRFRSHSSDSARADARSLSCDQKSQHVQFFREFPTICLTRFVVSAEASLPAAAWACSRSGKPQGAVSVVHSLNVSQQASMQAVNFACSWPLNESSSKLPNLQLARAFRLAGNPQDLRHGGLTPNPSPFSEFSKNQWFRLFVSVVDLRESL